MSKTRPPKDYTLYPATSVPDYDSFTTSRGCYIVDGEKREGGQSFIFPCTDHNKNRYVIKVFKADATPSDEQLNLTEEISGKKLAHILPIVDSGETADKLIFQVIPYMTPILESEINSVKKLLNIISDLVTALSALHGAGIIHRDVTPYNCFRSESDAYIGDLGSIVSIDVSIPELNQGLHMSQRLHAGTRGYTAPEVFFGLADHNSIHSTASDCYSLGSTLASIVSGKDVFDNISEAQYYSMLAEGRIPIDFPDYLDDKYRTAVRNLIDGLTSTDIKTRWDLEMAKKWLADPLLFSVKTKFSDKTQYIFDPAAYFDGHFYKTGAELAAAMINTQEKALKFIRFSDFSSIMAAASISLADSITKLMSDKAETEDALLCKIVKLLNPGGPFLSYKGTVYASQDDLTTTDSEILHEMLSLGLVSFGIKHTGNIQVDETVIQVIEDYEAYSRQQPKAFRYTAAAFKLFMNGEKKTEHILSVCQLMAELLRCPERIAEYIFHAEEITDDTFFSYMYFKGYRSQTQILLTKLLSRDKKYEKSYALCAFFEEILKNSSENDKYHSCASQRYLKYLKLHGPDSWILTFTRKCLSKYKPLNTESEKTLRNLASYNTLLVGAKNYTSWNYVIPRFQKLYAEFNVLFQSDILLSAAGIRGGKSIFACDLSGFYITTSLEQTTVPKFCQ